MWTAMSTAALLAIARCITTDKWIKKVHIYTHTHTHTHTKWSIIQP
jgi:hypothetical protein